MSVRKPRKRIWRYDQHQKMMNELNKLQEGLEQGRYSVSDVSNIERCLSNLMTSAAYIVGYAMARGAAGTGDGGHESAVKEAKKQQKAVRKALGYVKP